MNMIQFSKMDTLQLISDTLMRRQGFSLLTIVVMGLMMATCSSETADTIELFPLGGDQGYQYVDKTGKVVIPSQFSDAGIFTEGRALVRTGGSDGRWGFIDRTGQYVIQPIYKEAIGFSEGIAWVTEKDGAPTAIALNGDTLFTLRQAERVMEFHDGLAAFSVIGEDGHEQWGFTDKKGNVVIKPRFSDIGNYSDGMAAVMDEKQAWGYVNDGDELVIPHQFDHAAGFNNGLAVAGTGSSKGLIDRSGKFRVNPMFTEAIADGDRFLVEQGGKWGWISKEGSFIINPQFTEAMRFGGQGLAAVRTGKNWGYIGRDGIYKINPQFSAALPFTGNVALVLVERQSGLIDADGRFLVNPQFGKPSKDLVYMMMKGERFHRYIRTDYFNIPALLNAISPDNLEQIDFGTVAGRYGLDQNNHSSGNRHVLIPEKRINADLSVTLYAMAYPFRRETVRRSFGGYTYTDEEAVFDPSIPVKGYEYRIGLSGKGHGRSASVMKALRSEFPGAAVVTESDSEVMLRTADGSGQVRITSGYYGVTLRISFGQEADDTAVD